MTCPTSSGASRDGNSGQDRRDRRANGQVALGRPVLPDPLARRARLRAGPGGRERTAGQPAREVRVGDVLQVKTPSGDFEVQVLALNATRGPAKVAQMLYRETEASRELRLKLAEERKAMPPLEPRRKGRPSKRYRRQIARLRGRTVR